MTPERLDEIEVHFRRHPTSPNTVSLALELVEALRARGLAKVQQPAPEVPAAEVIIPPVPEEATPTVIVAPETEPTPLEEKPKRKR